MFAARAIRRAVCVLFLLRRGPRASQVSHVGPLLSRLELFTLSHFVIGADTNRRVPQECHRQAITESIAPNTARLMPVSLQRIFLIHEALMGFL
jgi:hypothetical protein